MFVQIARISMSELQERFLGAQRRTCLDTPDAAYNLT